MTLSVLRFRKPLAGHITRKVCWPQGASLTSFEPARDGIDARTLLNNAYAKGGGEIQDFATWSTQLITDEEYDPTLCFVVREATTGRIIGFAQCWTSAFVKDLAVAEDWRGKGLGRTLMAHIFEAFDRRNAVKVELKVEADNPSGAVKFYEAIGMERLED